MLRRAVVWVRAVRRLISQRDETLIEIETMRQRCSDSESEARALRHELEVLSCELDVHRRDRQARDAESADAPALFPAGHYHSPIPSLGELAPREQRIFAIPPMVPGIELDRETQLVLVERLAAVTADIPFPEKPEASFRYHFANEFFGYGDAVVLFGLLRLLRPERIVEIGSGFSSALILDTNDRYLDSAVRCTFIEPNPERLYSLLRDSDREAVTIVEKPLQDIDHDLADDLHAGDFLFIDSSHVSKTGSDVNMLLFDVLPRLRPGVVVHIHDIFFPFEYPREWVHQGRAWNENYLIRAFLEFNSAFRILLFNDFLSKVDFAAVASRLPYWARLPGGSLWIERL